MPRFTYSQAMLRFIERGFKKMGVPALTEAFNQEFGLNKTHNTIKSVIQNYKFTCGRSEVASYEKGHPFTQKSKLPG